MGLSPESRVRVGVEFEFGFFRTRFRSKFDLRSGSRLGLSPSWSQGWVQVEI